MKELDKKGFTLIELLAVIVILGVIMLIAIPSVSSIIANSRKNTYKSTAETLISGARNMVLSTATGDPDTNGDWSEITTQISKINELSGANGVDAYAKAYVIAVNNIKVEQGSNTRSPYGNLVAEQSFVVAAKNKDGSYDYYIQLYDDASYAIQFISEKDLSKNSVDDVVKQRTNVTGGTGEKDIIKIDTIVPSSSSSSSSS